MGTRTTRPAKTKRTTRKTAGKKEIKRKPQEILIPGERLRKDGRYEKRWTFNGRAISVIGRTVEELRTKVKKKEKQVEAGIYHTNDRITLNQYFKEWIDQKEMTLKESTIMIYENAYHANIEPVLGRYRLRDIERRQIVSMLNNIAKSGRIGAAKYTKTLIGSILKTAVTDDVVVRNVAAGIPPIRDERPPARETVHRELTEEELKAFFSLVKNSLYYNHFRFMLYTGTRVGECCGLQWQDIDWLRKIIHIRRTVTRDRKGRYILGKTTKTKKSRRDIPINPSILEVLGEQWERYVGTHEVVNMMDLVFPGEQGKQSGAGAVGEVLRYTVRKGRKQGIYIEPFGVHAFRDTFASRAIRAGIPPNTLKEILGHTSLAMTMDLYAHVSREDKVEGMSKMTAIDF